MYIYKQSASRNESRQPDRGVRGAQPARKRKKKGYEPYVYIGSLDIEPYV